MLKGSFVALVTPFRGGRVDLAAMDRLVDCQIAGGTQGLVPCGTTGEAPTLGPEEYAAVVGRVVRRAKGRVPVVAGAGSNDTRRSADLARLAAKAGADAILLVTPYYNKPSQAGIRLHAEAVRRACGLPIVLYNVPGRTGVSVAPETAAFLFEKGTIAALKEASDSVETTSQMLERCPRLPILSGSDSLNVPLVAVGAVGTISVVANVAPDLVRRSIDAALAGEREIAIRIHRRLYPLARALFVEGNPVPVKAALRMMGMGNGELRLPLAPLSKANEPAVRGALLKAGLLDSRRKT